MRTREEILADRKQAIEFIFLEVLLDIRELLTELNDRIITLPNVLGK